MKSRTDDRTTIRNIIRKTIDSRRVHFILCEIHDLMKPINRWWRISGEHMNRAEGSPQHINTLHPFTHSSG